MPEESENIRKATALQNDAWESFNRGERLKNEVDSMGRIDLNGAIEAFQHCIELSIKSLYQFQGIPHPLKHDPTAGFEKIFNDLLIRGKNTPEISKDINYWKRMLARARWISMICAKFHELSVYAFESVPTRDFFDDKDVEYLSRISKEVYYTAFSLIANIYYHEMKTREQAKREIPSQKEYLGLTWLES